MRAIPAAMLRGPGQDAPQPLVGREGPPVDEADRRELAGPLGVERLDRLLLEDLVDLLEEGEVVGCASC